MSKEIFFEDYTVAELKELVRKCNVVLPYVLGTLNSSLSSSDDKDWIKVHGGRCSSSIVQLESIERILNREVQK